MYTILLFAAEQPFLKFVASIENSSADDSARWAEAGLFQAEPGTGADMPSFQNFFTSEIVGEEVGFRLRSCKG